MSGCADDDEKRINFVACYYKKHNILLMYYFINYEKECFYDCGPDGHDGCELQQ